MILDRHFIFLHNYNDMAQSKSSIVDCISYNSTYIDF